MTSRSSHALTGDDRSRKVEEQRHYDRRAGDADDPCYDWTCGSARMNVALRAPYRYLESLIASYGAGKRVLDFGCGEGIFSIQPARDGATVIGIDISARSLAVARRRAVREGVSTHTLFCLGDCETLPFPDRSFDLVMSCGTLSCLDLRRGISEMARVLRPDGHAIIVDTLGHNVLLNLRRRWETWRGNRTNWTREHILKLPDLRLLDEHFGHCAVQPFDLSTLALACFSRRMTWLLDAASSVDRWVLGRPALKRLAFKVVVEASAPKRHVFHCPTFSVADARA